MLTSAVKFVWFFYDMISACDWSLTAQPINTWKVWPRKKSPQTFAHWEFHSKKSVGHGAGAGAGTCACTCACTCVGACTDADGYVQAIDVLV